MPLSVAAFPRCRDHDLFWRPIFWMPDEYEEDQVFLGDARWYVAGRRSRDCHWIRRRCLRAPCGPDHSLSAGLKGDPISRNYETRRPHRNPVRVRRMAS